MISNNKTIFLTAAVAITMIIQGNNLINAVEMIQNWAKPGLNHAVNSHIIEGDNNGKINPERELTRAELATMVNRILGLSEKADLSNYSDVDTGKWYYEDLSKVVKAGIYQGDGKNLRPEDTVTREEVFTIISRVYDIKDTNKLSKDFKDSQEISSWAKDLVLALVGKGFVNGDELENLNPKKTMTRAEFATMFTNMTPKVISKSGDYKSEKIKGNLLINANNVNLDGMEIDGDLILAEGMGISNISLKNVIVKGKILTRGGKTIKLEVEKL